MPENLGYQFNRLYNQPIETYRQVNTVTERNAIPMGIRWQGMPVHVVTENITYELIGGIENTNWVEQGVNPTNPVTHFKGYFDATALSPAINNTNGIEGDEYKVTNGGVTVNFGSGNIDLSTDDILIYFEGEWIVKVRANPSGSSNEVFSEPFMYPGNYPFLTSNPINAIIDIQIDHGCNYDEYFEFDGNEVTAIGDPDDIMFSGNKVKIIYK